MDKNTLTGLILIAAIFITFSIYNQPSKEQLAEQRRVRDSIQLAQRQASQEDASLKLDESVISEKQSNVSAFFAAGASDSSSADSTQLTTDSPLESSASALSEEMVTLENEKIRLQIDPRGGRIHSIQLIGYKNHKGDSLFIYQGDEARFDVEMYNRQSVHLSTEKELFKPMFAADGKSVIMRLENSPKQYIDFIYTLPENEFLMDFAVRIAGMKDALHPESSANLKMKWEQKLRQQEQGRMFENRFARIHYKYDKQDVKRMSESRSAKQEITEPVKWFAFKDQFFSMAVIADKPFQNTILTSDVLNDAKYLKDYKAEVWAPITPVPGKDELVATFKYYIGPVHYNTLKAYDSGVAKNDKLYLEDMVYLGYPWLSWINKYFVIPVFNFFLSLDWNMGLIILILTLMVKLIVSPLTFKSFMSSAKMRVLRPQIQEIEKKYPGKDQDMMLKRQQATMDLYRRVGASPLSGCLPMLIQMPVLLALFFFFPSAIELRQQSFLWAHDLSTYDTIISWSGNIPFVTKFLGNHLSLFCVLMTVTNVLYTKYNMAATDTGQSQMAGMKYMPYFMSVFMFFFLNKYPAGLNYYYFLSTLFTILIMTAFKIFVDEDKVLAKLEANKKKARKKSGFMARLEEAQKMQQKQARERAKQNAKKYR